MGVALDSGGGAGLATDTAALLFSDAGGAKSDFTAGLMVSVEIFDFESDLTVTESSNLLVVFAAAEGALLPVPGTFLISPTLAGSGFVGTDVFISVTDGITVSSFRCVIGSFVDNFPVESF